MAGAPAGYDVVLSYGRADHAAANALRDRLTQAGKLRVFIDWRALSAGCPWQPALETALSGCPAIVVLVGRKASAAGSSARSSSASTGRRLRRGRRHRSRSSCSEAFRGEQIKRIDDA